MAKSFSGALAYAAGAVAFGLALVVPATAQDLTATSSCFSGDIPSRDYAEIGANFRETLWDQSAGVRVVASETQLELSVVNESGENVCEDQANMTAECRFKLRSGSTFWIKVDNSKFDRSTKYKLCAF